MGVLLELEENASALLRARDVQGLRTRL